MAKKTDKFKTLIAEMEAAKNRMVEEGKVLFNDAVKDLFSEHPEMDSFSWAQYTPYFNDGDECIFGVHGDEPDINQIDGYEITKGWKDYPAKNPELIPAQEAVAELLNSAPEDMMKDLFGNHTKITVYRNGKIEKDDYDHE